MESVTDVVIQTKFKGDPTEGALLYFNRNHFRSIRTIQLLKEDEHIGEIVKHLLGLILKDNIVSYYLEEQDKTYLETAEHFAAYIEKINTALMVAPETIVCGLVNGEFRIRLDYEKEYCSKEKFLMDFREVCSKGDRIPEVVIIDNPNEFLKTYKKDSEE